MKYALGNMLNGAGGLNADQLALDLQFAADKTLTARKGPTPVLTRGSTGTFVGSNGLIQTAAVNAARFDHDPVTLSSRGLLIEEGRTNAAFQSGTIVNNVGWVASQGATGATSAASGTGPDSNTSYLISETATTAPHGLYNTGTNTGVVGASVTSGTAYTASCFVKKAAGSIDWIQIGLGTAGFGTQYANFNLSTGQFGNSSGLTTRIETHANGWYRISITANATTTTSTTATFGVDFINNTNGTSKAPSYAGSTSNQFLLAMCQFEAGSFPTSYIPTTTSALARSADVCSITGANFTGMWNATEGSLFASAIFHAPSVYPVAQQIVDINDTTANNRLRVFRTTNGEPGLFQTTAGSTNVQIVSGSIVTRTTQNMSAGFKLDDYVLYRNNASIGTDNLGAFIVSPTTMTIGDASSGVGTRAYLNGTISAIRYYRKRLANAKLQALTA